MDNSRNIQKLTKVLRPNQVEVVFFGDFNKATVAADKLMPYCEKTKIQYDIESSRRRPKFKEAMIQIAEAHRETPEEIASQMLVENIGSDDESTQQNLQEIGSANAVVTVDDFDGFLISERSKRDNLKKAMASNPTPAKKARLISYELMLTTIDLKFAASIDDPDPDLALHLLERLLSEILPETTTSQLFRNPDVVEVLAALTNYIGSVELSEFDEALSRLLEARFTEIRAVAGSALEKVKVSSESSLNVIGFDLCSTPGLVSIAA